MTDYQALYEQQLQKNKELQEEFNQYALTHCCEMNCEKCGLTTTEDDLQFSLEYGSLICERCYEDAEIKENEDLKKAEEENKKLQEENKKLKISLQNNRGHRKKAEAENKKLKEEISHLKQYQEDIDSVEENLLGILQDAEVKDKFGDTYEELTYEMVPELVKTIIEKNNGSK